MNEQLPLAVKYSNSKTLGNNHTAKAELKHHRFQL